MKRLVTTGLFWFFWGGACALSSSAPPLPSFASLRANPVNLRCGPGSEYEVTWVFTRRGWPVKIIGTFENWRQIQDADQIQGWVHQKMLSKQRTVVVTAKPETLLRKQSDKQAAPIARVQAGVIGKLERCEGGQCFVHLVNQQKTIKGWIDKTAVWGSDVP